MIEIDQKIVAVEVEKEVAVEPPKREALKSRPESLVGATYKIKSPSMEHSYYITINDNPDGVPFEIFINSKDTEHFQWIASLTRMISAVFRRADNIDFMIEELKATVDPAGGLGFCKLVGMSKPKFISSIPAAIGYILEYHTRKEVTKAPVVAVVPTVQANETSYPESATVCKKCGEKAVVLLDGCPTCLACQDSKCG